MIILQWTHTNLAQTVLGEVTVVILGCGAKVDEFKILIIYT
jgi:hypothetical protein